MAQSTPPWLHVRGDDSSSARAASRSSNTSSDQVLWDDVLRERCCHAFVALVERYEPLLRAFARKVNRSEDLGRDVAQEVFPRLSPTPERYRPERASVRSFLLRDCYGRAVSRVRYEDATRNRGRDWSVNCERAASPQRSWRSTRSSTVGSGSSSPSALTSA